MVAGEKLCHEVYELEKVGDVLDQVVEYVIDDAFPQYIVNNRMRRGVRGRTRV